MQTTNKMMITSFDKLEVISFLDCIYEIVRRIIEELWIDLHVLDWKKSVLIFGRNSKAFLKLKCSIPFSDTLPPSVYSVYWPAHFISTTWYTCWIIAVAKINRIVRTTQQISRRSSYLHRRRRRYCRFAASAAGMTPKWCWAVTAIRIRFQWTETVEWFVDPLPDTVPESAAQKSTSAFACTLSRSRRNASTSPWQLHVTWSRSFGAQYTRRRHCNRSLQRNNTYIWKVLQDALQKHAKNCLQGTL